MKKDKKDEIMLDVINESYENKNQEEEQEETRKKNNNNYLTMGEFLSTSKEIKQKYNNYVLIGFSKRMDIRRTQEKNLPYRMTYDKWMRLFLEFAEN